MLSYSNLLADPDKYIDFAENGSVWRPSLISQNDNNYRVAKTSSMFYQSRNKHFASEIEQTLIAAGADYSYKNSLPLLNMETPQLIKYEPGDGFYSWHSDVSYTDSDSDQMKQRVFSLVLYLNDVLEGGETEFRNFGIKVKPEAGTAILFPANYAYIHRANMPKSGPKYIVVTWFGY